MRKIARSLLAPVCNDAHHPRLLSALPGLGRPHLHHQEVKKPRPARLDAFLAAQYPLPEITVPLRRSQGLKNNDTNGDTESQGREGGVLLPQ